MLKTCYMELREFLKRYRKATQYSGRILAEKMGASKSLLEKWENSNYTPSAADTEKIKKYFGLRDLDKLIEKVLQKCIEGVSPSNEELLKQNTILLKKNG
ncbi:MAG: helix-turn-helix transcriptional regulator [Niabella sp.]